MSRRKEEAQQLNSTDPLQSAIAEGRQYIRQIRAANDAIPGEEISQKIDELEIVTAKIFEYISKRPEKLPQIRRFMSYYLPTTSSTLSPYRGKILSRQKQKLAIHWTPLPLPLKICWIRFLSMRPWIFPRISLPWKPCWRRKGLPKTA